MVGNPATLLANGVCEGTNGGKSHHEVSRWRRRPGWATPVQASSGGPSLRDLAAVVSENIAAAAMRELLARVTFNVAIGNADAHARNYSVLLHADGRVTLAPMYDLVCTTAFSSLSTDPAQLINAVDDIEQVTSADLLH